MVVHQQLALPKPEFNTGPRPASVANEVRHGASLYEKGDTLGALMAYDAALSLKPDDANLRRTRGLLLGELDRFEEALAEFDRLLVARPRDTDLLLLKGMALYKLARYQESLTVCDEAIRLSPDESVVHAMRGYALDALDRCEDALEAFDHSLALEDNPHITEARRAILDSYLWSLVRGGSASWSGGKPRGSKHPAKLLSGGPPVSDYIIEERRRQRGA
jgi:tetratricopeptide (TPR) repeat protein